MPSFDLSNRTAWVTGSTKNLGRAMVEDLADNGANVVISNKSGGSELAEAKRELQEEYKTEVASVQVDIGKENSVNNAVEKIRSDLGSVDILVNNAAIRPHQSIDETTIEDWEQVIQTNLTGSFLCTKAVWPDMKSQNWGRVISISGMDGFTGKVNRPHGVASKAGIDGLTRAFAQEGGEHNITANCVVPGAFKTDRPEEWYPNLESQYELKRNRTPLQRLGEPKDISPTIVFLSSEEASYITGQTIHVNGGLFPTIREPSDDEFAELDEDSLY